MKKIPVWKNAVLLFAAFAVIVIATFAWFYKGPNATNEDVGMDVGYASYIQIAGDNGGWSEELNAEFGVKKFKELSGNGIDFFAPVYDFIEDANGGFSTQIVSFETANGSEYYYEHVYDVRSDVSQTIYLSSGSFVSSFEGDDNSYIDGAIRVAFFEVDESGEETLKFIWAPNSAVEYSVETNSFSREGSVEPYYYFQKSLNPVDIDLLDGSNEDIARISTEDTDESGCGYNQEYKFLWTNGRNMPDNVPSILTLDNLGEDDHYHKKLKVKVWLEGYDRECVKLLSGQKFTMKLQFTK